MQSLGLLFFAVLALPLSALPTARIPDLPLRFEADGERFVACGSGLRVQLTNQGSLLQLTAGERTVTIASTLLHANPPSRLEGLEPQSAAINYYYGDARITGVRAYGRVRYHSVYPGIDLVFHGNGRELEYDFIAAPGANPVAIELEISRQARLRLDESGDLIMATDAGDARWRRPEVYQIIGGRRRMVAAGFALRGHNRVGFTIGRYDRSYPLVIDPTLAYATYLGGSGNDSVRAVAVDSAGNAYVTGVTTSPNLPVAQAAQPAYGGNTISRISGDAFVAKFDPAGKLLYLTYLGGSGDDFGTAIAVDAAGNAWVTGATTSTNFPVTSATAVQPRLAGAGGNGLYKFGDAFLAKIGTNGGALLYATYFGGQLDDWGTAITLDSAGNIYLTGATISRDFPTKGAYQPNYRGAGGEQVFPRYGVIPYDAGDVFVAKFSATNQQLVFSTYVGGAMDDQSTAITVDAAGNVFVAGFTLSTDFPTTPGAFQRSNHGSDVRNNIFWNFGDAFIFKLNPTGSSLVYSTLLGGNGDDLISGIAIDSAGNALVTGSTCSTDFPVTAGALQTRLKGPFSAPVADQLIGDAFLVKLNPAGTALVFATYLGGTDDDAALGIAIEPNGNILLSGFTNSTDFPTTSDAAQRSFGGRGQQNEHQDFGDAFLMELNPTASAILYSTYLGGNADDEALGMALDRAGNVFVAGSTVSRSFPLKSAFQTSFGGSDNSTRIHGDAFVARYSGFAAVPSAVVTLSTAASSATVAAGSTFSYTFSINNAGPGSATNLKLDATASGAAIQVTGASISSGSCSALTCTNASLAQGAGATLTIQGTAQQVGVATVTVTLNWDLGTQKTVQISVTVTPPAGGLQFGLPVSKSLSGGAPVAIAIGAQNLFVLTKNVEIFAGAGLSPQPPIVLPPEFKPAGLLVQDQNVIVLDSASGSVTIYAPGDGGYGAIQGFGANTNASAMTLLSSGLAVIGDDGVAVFTANGDGTFTPAVTFDLPDRQGKLQAIAAGQFTGAGSDDLVLADAGGNIWLAPSDGMGGFNPASVVQAGMNAVALVTGDFNGDGNLDLAVSNNTAGTVSVLLGDGAGNLSAAGSVAVGSAPLGLVAGDLDGDGSLDLAVAVSGRNTVALLRNDGAGNFQPVQYGVGAVPANLAVGDLDGDGLPDIAVANRQSGDVSVLLKVK